MRQRLLAWTPEQLETLRTLWEAGATARAIAIVLGGEHLRSAVIGKANRLHLSPRPSPVKRAVPKVLSRMPVPVEWR